MWILERFFATLKKGSHPIWLGLVVVAHLLFGCVVTDKITFEEETNHPIAYLEAIPEEHFIPLSTKEDLELSIIVWDPDIYDPDEQQIDARLAYTTDYWEGDEYDCKGDGVINALQGEENIYDIEGIPFKITCELKLDSLVLIDDTLVSVTMTISDLGFQNNGKPKNSANLVVHNWTVQYIPGLE